MWIHRFEIVARHAGLIALIASMGVLAACGGSSSPTTPPIVDPGPAEPTDGSDQRLSEIMSALSAQAEGWRENANLDEADEGPRDFLGVREEIASRSSSQFATPRLRLEDNDWIAPDLDNQFRWEPESDEYRPVGERSHVTAVLYSESASLGTNETKWRIVWGGWSDYSYFGVTHERDLQDEDGVWFDHLSAFSEGRPVEYLQEGGMGMYRGFAAARQFTNLDSAAGLPVFSDRSGGGLFGGRVEVVANFSEGSLDVTIDDLVDLDTGAEIAAPEPWLDIEFTFAGFSDQDGVRLLEGSFYGESGAEVGGVFRTEDLVGAFGTGYDSSDSNGDDSGGTVSNPSN